jgi:hypothetical protein
VSNRSEAFSFNRRGLLAAGLAALLGCGAAGAAPAANAPDPVAFITAIYRAAVKGEGPSWIDKRERPRYLSKSLVALWAKTDKKSAGDGAVIDFDLVTDTNGLTLTGFSLAVEKQDEKTATIAATLVYKEGNRGSKPTKVRYDLVREDGQWKIDEIRGDKWSARDMLTLSLKP